MSTNTLNYLGSKISLISNAGIRYEGTLYNINPLESTVGLSNVRSFGTEGRKMGSGLEIPPGDEIYDFIIFRGRDIKDLTVSEASPPDDPAIVAINSMPTAQGNTTNETSPMHTQNRYQMPYMMNRNNIMSSHQGHQRNDYHQQHHRDDYYQYPRTRFGGHHQQQQIIGELQAQPNQSLKSMVEEVFNFEEANSKFDKANSKMFDNKENTTDSTNPSTQQGASQQTASLQNQGSATVPESMNFLENAKNYDRKISFFDNISCETLDRQLGNETRFDRVKQRQVDVDTFGPSAVQKSNQKNNRNQRNNRNLRIRNNMSNLIPHYQRISVMKNAHGFNNHPISYNKFNHSSYIPHY